MDSEILTFVIVVAADVQIWLNNFCALNWVLALEESAWVFWPIDQVFLKYTTF